MMRGSKTKLVRSIAAVALLASVGVGCGSDDEEDSTPATASDGTDAPPESEAPDAPAATELAEAGEGGEFAIKDFGFPADFSTTAGSEISISNKDSFAHTVTSAEFDVRVEGNATETLTIDTAGEYAIVCNIHPQMTGTITVE